MKRSAWILIPILVLILFAGCKDGSSDLFEGPYDTTSYAITGANIRGGIAVALGSDSSSRDMGSMRNVSREITSENIYTIFENGEYADALTFNVDYYSSMRPTLRFTAIANGYLYVRLDDWYGGLGLYAINLETEEIFKAILPDGIQGSFKDWYWSDTTVKTKPIVFNKDGVAYFVVNTWSPSGGSNTDRLVSWTPGTDATAQFVTPAINNNVVERFQIDDDNRLYIYGQIYGTSYTKYLQVHDPRSTRVRYVYYSDTGSDWIRGYATSGSSVVINGYNIMGTNGIVKIDSELVDGNLKFTSYPLYSNDTSNWFDPTYNEWYDSWANKTYHTGLFTYTYNSEYGSYAYSWAEDYRNGDGTLKTDEILAYISTFYVHDIYIDFSTLDRVFSQEEIYGTTYNYWTWLEANVKLASDTSVAATTFYRWRTDNNLGWLDFSNISDMAILDDGSLWGVFNPQYNSSQTSAVLKLLDAEGKRDLDVITTKDASGDDVRASKIQFNGYNMFYMYAGSEPGTHRLASLDIHGNFKDLTQNVTDIEYMTIYDYAVTSEHVYFSGFDGIDTISGKIDLATLAYSEITTGITINSIEVLL